MKRQPTTLVAASAIALSLLAGCSAADTITSQETTTVVEATTATGALTGNTTVDSETVAAITQTNIDDHASADHYLWEASEVVDVSLGSEITADGDGVLIEGSTVTITEAGAYHISGTLSDGQIAVEADDEAVVRLILANADITNTTGAAIAIMSAETAVVILAEGTDNTLTDAAMYLLAEGEDEPNAALYSASNLSIGGEGSLMVYGNYNDGITSKDGLIIDAGNISVEAVDDGIRGKDYVIVNGGTLDVTAAGDGTFGPGGGGRGRPGQEPGAPGAEIVGDYQIFISGGTIVVDAIGDGIDSNGDVVMTGGTVVLNAATNGRDNATDSNGTFEMLGGTLIGTNVDARVSEGVEGTSSQGAIYLPTGSMYAAGTVIHLETAGGDSVLTFETSKEFSVLVFSSPDLVAGETYHVYFDGSTSGEDLSGLYGSDAYTPGTLVGTVIAS